MIRNFLLPSLYHSYIFSKLFSSHLNKIDIVIRKAIRRFLHLPHELPKAAFNARVADGVLGIPALRYLIPVIASKRLKFNKPNPNLTKIEGREIRNSDQINRYFRQELLKSVDGKGLLESDVLLHIRWINDGTSFIIGKDFISCIHLRYNILYSRSRCSRGRGDKEKMCRRGCDRPEILNDILQTCYATHSARIKRHNAIVHYIQRISQDRGFTVHKEKQFIINNSTLKPDLILYSDDRIDSLVVQIINDKFSPRQAHVTKKEKCEVLKDQLDGLRPGGIPLRRP